MGPNPAHLRAGENNLFLLSLAPCLEQPITSWRIAFTLFQRYRKCSSPCGSSSSIPAWRCIHCMDTLSWRKNNPWDLFSIKSDLSATSRCFSLSTINTQLQVLSLKALKDPILVIPPANPEEQEITPCPRTQSLEEKLPRAAACPSNTCEWGDPGSQWQQSELSTAFYCTTFFSSLKYSPTHPILEPKLWFWDTSLGEELCSFLC